MARYLVRVGVQRLARVGRPSLRDSYPTSPRYLVLLCFSLLYLPITCQSGGRPFLTSPKGLTRIYAGVDDGRWGIRIN
jgi:hypothetical protein